jgi:hypothetical protein
VDLVDRDVRLASHVWPGGEPTIVGVHGLTVLLRDNPSVLDAIRTHFARR